MLRVLRIAALSLFAAAILLLALVGLFTLLRGSSPGRVRAVGDSEGVPAVTSREFVRTVSLLTRTAMLPEPRVQLMLDGPGTFPPLGRDLRAARRSITLQLYYITPGFVLDSLVAVLRERATAGVDVRLLYDDVGSDIPEAQLAALRGAGAHAEVFRPVKWYTLHKAQNRSHARTVVIDGKVGWTGGFGIDDRWAGAAGWRDTNVRFEGPPVAQLQASFVTAWAEAVGGLLVGELFFPDTALHPLGDVVRPPLAGVLQSYSAPGTTDAERLFALTAAGARERLYLTNAYFVPSDAMMRALLDAARRGVDVRLLLPGAQTDVPMTRRAARARYEELLRAGIRIYEYRRRMIHAKTMVADGMWSSVGTMNLDIRSLVHNDEVNLLVWDPAFGRSLESVFAADLMRASEMQLASFRRRGWREKLGELVAGQLTRLL